MTLSGHADDVRVCAAVSTITSTLYNGYSVAKPTSGSFHLVFDQVREAGVVDFVLNTFRLLSRQYPQELQVQE